MNNKVNRFLLYANPLLLAKLMMKKKDVPPITGNYFKFNMAFTPTIPESVEKIKVFVNNRQQEIPRAGGQVIVKENETLSWDFVEAAPTGQYFLTAAKTGTLVPEYIDVFKYDDGTAEGAWTSGITNDQSIGGATSGKLVADSFTRFSEYPSGSTINMFLISNAVADKYFDFKAHFKGSSIDKVKVQVGNSEAQAITDGGTFRAHLGELITWDFYDNEEGVVPITGNVTMQALRQDGTELEIFKNDTDWSSELSRGRSDVGLPNGYLDYESFTKYTDYPTGSTVDVYFDVYNEVVLVNENTNNTKIFINNVSYDVPAVHEELKLAGVRLRVGDKVSFNPIQGEDHWCEIYTDNTYEEPAKVFDCSYPDTSTSQINKAQFESYYNHQSTALWINELQMRTDAFKTSSTHKINASGTLYFDIRDRNSSLFKTAKFNNKADIESGCKYNIKISQNGSELLTVDTSTTTGEARTLNMNEQEGTIYYKFEFEDNEQELPGTMLYAYKMNGEQKEYIEIFKVGSSNELRSFVTSEETDIISIGYQQLQQFPACWNIFFEWCPIPVVPDFKMLYFNMKEDNENACGYNIQIKDKNNNPVEEIYTDVTMGEGKSVKYILDEANQYKVRLQFNNFTLKNTKLSAYKMNSEQKELVEVFKKSDGTLYSSIVSVEGTQEDYTLDYTAMSQITDVFEIYFEWEYTGNDRKYDTLPVYCKTYGQARPTDNILKIGYVEVNVMGQAETFGPYYLEASDFVQFKTITSGEKYSIASAFKDENMVTPANVFTGNQTGAETNQVCSEIGVSGIDYQMQLEQGQQSSTPIYIHVNYLS